MPSPGKPGPSPPRIIAIDVESQGRPAGTPYKGHHARDTYDGDLVPRPCGEFSASPTLGGNMKVTFKVRGAAAADAMTKGVRVGGAFLGTKCPSVDLRRSWQ